MRMRSLFLALLSLAVLPYARAQYTTLTASEIQDVTGAALGSGYLCLTPVNASGVATPFTIGGGKGQVVPSQKCYAIYQGGITSAPVPDTSLTVPAIGYQVTILDAFNHLVVQYSQPIKPTGSTFNFDTWQPSVTASVSPAGAFIFFGATVPTTGCTAPSFGYTTAGALYSCLGGVWSPVSTPGGGSGSSRVVYTSQLLGTTGDAVVAAGSATTGTDRAAAINAAIAGGNVKLVVDGQYGLGSSLVLNSNTVIDCLPGQGFIMRPSSNAPMYVNAHPSAATVASGTGGYLVSNIVDHDISILGCFDDFNSAQAATGSFGGIGNMTDGSRWIFGMRFLGVRNLDIERNHTYDSPTYSIAGNNLDGFTLADNFVDQPAAVAGKHTDGLHINGPAQNGKILRNHLHFNSDDGIALNADDGYLAKFGDPNYTVVDWPGWENGPITNVLEDGNIFDASNYGYRLLSCTELIDQITIRNTEGTLPGLPAQIGHEYAGYTGNIGRVVIDGWNATATGAQGAPAGRSVSGWYLNANIDTLRISGVQMDKIVSANPFVLQAGGTIQSLSVSNFDVDDQAGVMSQPFFQTNGTVNSLIASGFNWQETSTTSASVFGGSTPPSMLTFSAYSGPNKILATGYSPAVKNGDAFSNTYPANAYGTIYLQTSFNEAAAGAALAGTTPATFTGSGTWQQLAGTWVYISGGGIGQTSTIANGGTTGLAYINVGQANYTMRTAITSAQQGQQIFLRYTDPSHLVVLDINPQSAGIYDVSGSTTTQIGSSISGDFRVGTSTVVVNGSSITATLGGQTITGALPSGSSNLTSTLLGVTQYSGSGMTVSSLTVSSQ